MILVQPRTGFQVASVHSILEWSLMTPRKTLGGADLIPWGEVEEGVRIEDFRIDNAVERLHELGDLWKPVLAKKRVDLVKRFKQ